MSEPKEDATLVAQILQGHQEAFRPIVERYSGSVYRIAYSMTGNAESAKDVVQEVFYKVYKGLASYNPEWPFHSWVNRIAVNFILDQRKKKRIQSSSLTGDESVEMIIPDSTYDPRRLHYVREREVSVLKAIDQLSDKYRIVLMLRHIEQLSYEEIAQTLDLPVGTVMTHLHRARTKLSVMLRPFEEELLSP